MMFGTQSELGTVPSFGRNYSSGVIAGFSVRAQASGSQLGIIFDPREHLAMFKDTFGC